MTKQIQIAGYDIQIVIEQDADGIYAVAYCPICGYGEESHNHGYGAEHAARITNNKIRTHMKLSHQVN